MTASQHFGWLYKLATGGSPAKHDSPPSVATGRDAHLTTPQRPAPPRYYEVELQHQGLAMYVGGTAINEAQIAEIIENRWPEWRIVAVREER